MSRYPDCPHLPFDVIREKADQTRRQYSKDDGIPVDIEMMIEKMGLIIDPVPGLKQACDIDACLSGDGKTIYVDREYFLDERQLFRMRFTLAHELGHALLHRDIYEWYAQSKVDDVLDWMTLIRDFQFDADPFFERQAHEFAGRLLVPLEPLKDLFDSLVAKVDLRSLDDLSVDAVRDCLAQKIYRSFEVNVPVISTRIRVEKLYPFE